MSSRDVVVKSSLSMPSFSSFDPTRLSAPSTQDAALLDILDRSDSGESGEVSGMDRKSRKRKKKSKKDKSGKNHRRKELRDAAPRDDTRPPPFYKDRVGDSLNLTYGTIHGSAIPMYKCLGDRILGDPSGSWRIDYRASRNSRNLIIYRLGYSRDKLRGITSRYQAFKEAMKGRPIKMTRFIKSSKTKKNPTLGDFEALLDVPELMSKNGPKTDGAPGDEAEIDLDSFHADLEFRNRSAELESLVQKDRFNVKKWLDFIHYQDMLISAESSGKRKTSSLKRAVTEKKLSIFDKAFEIIPNDETLLVAYLKCCEDLSDGATLLTKWDQVLRENPTSFSLWNQYITLRETNFASFTVQCCLDIFEECIDAVTSIPHRDIVKLERNLIYVLNRLCSFLSQSGYTEKAVALYQCMIELTCFCPPAYAPQPFDQRLDLLESFWEKDIPRFGQHGAPGWLNSLFMDEYAGETVAQPIPETGILGSDDAINQWVKKERHGEYSFWTPQLVIEARRKTDDVEDPFRSVLFDDMRPYLFELSHSESKQLLILSFLHFLGFPLLRAFPLQSTDISPLYTFWDPQSLSGSSDDVLFEFPVASVQSSFSALFSDAPWFKAMNKEQIKFVQNSGILKKEFIRNVLEQAGGLPELHGKLVPSALIFEGAFEHKRGHKLAKSLLKVDQSNVSLWNAFAHLEECHGKLDEAVKVYQMALTAFQSSSGSIRSELELVYMSLASLEWSRGDSRAAVGVLLACLNGSGPPSKTTTYTPTQLLKAQGEWTLKAFEGIQSLSKDSLTSPLPSGTWTNTLCRLYCSLLFEYLVSESIESVSDLGRRFLSLENVKKTIELQECLYELVARFLYAQVKSSSGFKPGLIRSWLEEGLSHFPENTILLSVYGWVESKAGIENRTRRYLDGLLSERPSRAHLWLFAIWSEAHFKSQLNPHPIRSLLEQAVEKCPSSPALWTAYLHFEISHGTLSDRPKDLLYRALRSCPWSKALYLLAFSEPFKALFRKDELSQLFQLMVDKELRVRVPYPDEEEEAEEEEEEGQVSSEDDAY